MKTDILGVRFDNVTRAEATSRVIDYLDDDGFTRTVVTPNPEMVMEAVRNPEFCDILNLANLCVPDGIGIVIASKLLGGGIT
ncbi:MAG: glycosyltransferase, partial [Defluviitaleaceae bacterium]|nr:glycosyltransferase [Defluviitaleaceae bacterium]